LFIVSNAHAIGPRNRRTGDFLPEVAHPYAEFDRAGYVINFASLTGETPFLDALNLAGDPDNLAFLVLSAYAPSAARSIAAMSSLLIFSIATVARRERFGLASLSIWNSRVSTICQDTPQPHLLEAARTFADSPDKTASSVFNPYGPTVWPHYFISALNSSSSPRPSPRRGGRPSCG
jgi:hypothetical protein